MLNSKKFDMEKYVKEVVYHSCMIDHYLDADIIGYVGPEVASREVEYHSAMLTKYVFDVFGPEIISKVISYLDDEGALESIKK